MRVRATHDVLLAARKLLGAATDAESGQRGYLITLNESYLASYHIGLATAAAELGSLETMSRHRPQQSARLVELRGLWTAKADELAATIELARKSGVEAAQAEVNRHLGKNLMDRIRQVVSDLEVYETASRNAAIREQTVLDKQVFVFIQLTTFATFAALLYLLYQARQAASQLEKEVAIRLSAEDLGRERAEQTLQVRIMNRELVHRTKNLITVIQAIVRNQDIATPETAKYAAGLSSRLVSLAATMDILVRENWSQLALEDLIAGQLAHFSEDIGRRIAVKHGPTIKFSASESQMLGLALHELGTNAAKYGALSVPDGRIEICWNEDPDRDGNAIVLRWQETGGPAPSPPIQKGFGSRITGPLVARALSGAADTDYRPDGLIWTLTFPRERHGELRDSGAGNMTAGSAEGTTSGPQPV